MTNKSLLLFLRPHSTWDTHKCHSHYVSLYHSAIVDGCLNNNQPLHTGVTSDSELQIPEIESAIKKKLLKLLFCNRFSIMKILKISNINNNHLKEVYLLNLNY